MNTKALAKADRRTVAVKKTQEQLLDELMMTGCEVTGTHSDDVAMRMIYQATTVHVFPKSKDVNDRLITAIRTMAEMTPKNATEAMLAVQMIAAHDAALVFLKHATAENQSVGTAEATVLCATRLMRVFNEQLEAMARLKGKTGQQKVIVEHVHVHQGGQAIVGAVSAAKRNQGEGGA
jgi:hypothetical protein